MTEVLEPQYMYVRHPSSPRVVALCYKVLVNERFEGYSAYVGMAMNRPNDQFSKKIGRTIATGRMESVNSMILVPLLTLKKTTRRKEIIQYLSSADHSEWFGFDPLISRNIRETRMEKEFLQQLEKLMRDVDPLPPLAIDIELEPWQGDRLSGGV